MVKMTLNKQTLVSTFADLTTKKQFCIAYSGGVDSHVLLHLMATLASDDPSYKIRAIHINHGISAHAVQWQTHCEGVCRQLGVSYSSYNVHVKKTPGESLEALARYSRYLALADNIEPNECLLTAHNADDQAETLLLQLFRGAGVSGLASMPKTKSFAGTEHLRPLLTNSRDEIEAYASAYKLRWVEDDSNADQSLDRNYLRKTILPLIKQRWPKSLRTINRSASNCGDAASVIEELAKNDLSTMVTQDHALDINKLLELTELRQHNALRYWIKVRGFGLPNKKHLAQIYKTVINARDDAMPFVEWNGEQIRRYQNSLYLMHQSKSDSTQHKIIWNLKHDLELPDQLGILKIEKTQGQGIDASMLGAELTVRFRQGGERICQAGRKETHSVKKLFQQWSIPPWLRDKVPLLYSNDQLIAIVGYCVAEKFKAGQSTPGLMIYLISEC